MAMNLNLLRTLNSSYARARPMLASALRGPTMLLYRRFRACTKPNNEFKSNPATEVDNVYQQPTNEIQGLVEEGPTKISAASPEHTSTSPDHERVQESKLTGPEKLDEVKLEELRAELMALPESPQGAIREYGCFVRHIQRTSAITGEFVPKATVMDMWKALSDTERQQFTKEAQDNQLLVAEYDEWAQVIGYPNLRQINRDRVLSGKERLRMPTSLRRVRKLSGFKTFFKTKVASGEIFTRNGYAAAKKHAIELWIKLDPSQQAVYEAKSEADHQQRLALAYRRNVVSIFTSYFSSFYPLEPLCNRLVARHKLHLESNPHFACVAYN
ncbi:hypothetical protein BKA62DRAFT_830672 [Auriculariales sp. MPI-PUGE-AT-0066]|nr:hypothetical protein BKA62DRAFT_830672 [Auriculariales sp. MPI-PUGE-AT-0066]